VEQPKKKEKGGGEGGAAIPMYWKLQQWSSHKAQNILFLILSFIQVQLHVSGMSEKNNHPRLLQEVK